jgi:preprotein translocase subunit SecG
MNWFIIVFFIISIILFLVTKYYRLKKELELEKIVRISL